MAALLDTSEFAKGGGGTKADPWLFEIPLLFAPCCPTHPGTVMVRMERQWKDADGIMAFHDDACPKCTSARKR
jgi:hypothetical protein